MDLEQFLELLDELPVTALSLAVLAGIAWCLVVILNV
jgi:hypothetical protein